MERKKLMRIIWRGLALSLWITLIVIYTIIPEFKLLSKVILGTATGTTLLLLYIERQRLSVLFKLSFYRNFFTYGLRSVLVLGILAMINYVSLKGRWTKDLTKDQLHTLSDQSQKILGGLDDKMTLTLYAKRSDWKRYAELLNQYKNAGKFVELNFIDIESNPGLIAQKNITNNGTLEITYKESELSLPVKNELDITNLILKALNQKKVSIYYTVGHNELSPHDKKSTGGSFFYSKLQSTNYTVRSLDLLKSSQVPQNADLLLIIAPKIGFLESEIKKIRDYAQRGGNFLFMLPPIFGDFNQSELYAFIKDQGIVIENKLTIDRLSSMQGVDASIPIITSFEPNHSITKGFSGRVLFPISSSLLINKELSKEEKSQLALKVIAKSSSFPASWGESGLKNIGETKIFFNANQDTKGPINLAIVAKNSQNYSKTAVIASSQMISNAYQSQSYNFNFILNTISWLIDDEKIQGLNRPNLTENMIILSEGQLALIFYFSILFAPSFFFILGIVVYRKKVSK